MCKAKTSWQIVSQGWLCKIWCDWCRWNWVVVASIIWDTQDERVQFTRHLANDHRKRAKATRRRRDRLPTSASNWLINLKIDKSPYLLSKCIQIDASSRVLVCALRFNWVVIALQWVYQILRGTLFWVCMIDCRSRCIYISDIYLI